jgi:hypothetical protein
MAAAIAGPGRALAVETDQFKLLHCSDPAVFPPSTDCSGGSVFSSLSEPLDSTKTRQG